jgi:hypothetical protein
MVLRKLVATAPVIAALALAAPVATAGAQTPPGIPCYPYPAFCGPGGQSWLSFFFPSLPSTTPGFGPGPVQLPGLPALPGLPVP